MLINSPQDPTPGVMPADASATPDNVATITFDVVVDPSVIDGTVISNQGFVTAVDGGIVDQPSDDPATPAVNDPTRDIVGNLPLLFAAKSVVLFSDQGSPGVVDPGDVLRYTISVQNSGTIAATGVVLRDPVPANTTYVADSTTLNGLPVGQPDGGVAPLAADRHQPSDLTPPLPGRCGHDLARARRGAAVRPARQRRRAGGHADQQPGRGRDRGGPEPADRRRRQPGDGARADGRRGGQRPAARSRSRSRWSAADRRCRAPSSSTS